jgi:membrane fusion protein (multidrug efflux system)
MVGIAFLAGKLWYDSETRIETDNAFIEARIHSISPRIGGTVTAVHIQDNQRVSRGTLLIELDPTDYEVRLQKSAADLQMARNETAADRAEVESARAGLNSAKARLEQAEQDLKRGKALFAKEVIPREQLEKLETARKVSLAQTREAEERLRKAQSIAGEATTAGQPARVATREAQKREAALNLSYTKVYAPADGFITRKAVEPGNSVQPGQPLMALVNLSETWIIANYKERQLAHMKPGQKVEFTVDAYPGMKFRGTVESIMAGTGSSFSLLPPENASGNYVKVVQRIPVKIVIDGSSDPEHFLRVGMSVVPVVQTGRTLGDILKNLPPFR